MSLTEMLWGTILTAYNLYNTVSSSGLKPYSSWAMVHSHFERVPAYSTGWVPEKYLRTMMLFWWSIPVSSIIFFAFFAFGEEAMKEYRRVWRWIKNVAFWRRNNEKKGSLSQFSTSTCRPLKLITLKWPLSTSHSTTEPKSPTSIISQSTITIIGQHESLEPGAWKRSKSLEFSTAAAAAETQGFPLPTYYESTIVNGRSGTCSPTSSTHRTLIGQLIDPKRGEREKSQQDHRHHGTTLGLPDIDESDAFTIDSFSYYEDPVAPNTSRLSYPTPSTITKSVASSAAPPTPPHPPSPRFAFPQHSLPPPPVRKQPRAVGSLSSLLRLSKSAEADGIDERGRFSREGFTFHHHGNSHQQQFEQQHAQSYNRSPLYETWPSRTASSSPRGPIDLIQDVPEDVGPCSYTRPAGVLDSLPERDEFTTGYYVPLRRKTTVLGVEGGGINVVVERSASVDEDMGKLV